MTQSISHFHTTLTNVSAATMHMIKLLDETEDDDGMAKTRDGPPEPSSNL